MLLAYLSFAHPSSWIVYYFEVFPVFYVVAAIETVRLADWRSAIGPARARGLVLLALAVISPWLLNDLGLVRRQVDLRNAFHRTAARVLKTRPAYLLNVATWRLTRIR